METAMILIGTSIVAPVIATTFHNYLIKGDKKK